MGRTRRRAATILAAGLLTSLSATSATAGPTRATSANTRVTAVSFSHHAGFDRVVWTFAGQLPHHNVGYVKRVTTDPSGKPVGLAGNAKLHVVFYTTSTTANQPQGTWTPNLPEIRQVKGAGNFEGYTSYGVGLTAHRPFTVRTLTSPSRIVIDVKLP